jgi:hypothetical protein
MEADQGVFNIQVGTCITLAVADGSKAAGELARVSYNDAWMHDRMSRQSKLDWLQDGEVAGSLVDAIVVARGLLDPMRPTPFLNGALVSHLTLLSSSEKLAWVSTETREDHLRSA